MDLWVDYIHAYLAAVSYADSKIGAVLDAFEADPALAAETSICSGATMAPPRRPRPLGEVHQWREATEVPLIIVDPDAPGGQTADQIVSLVDIFPTVLDLMDSTSPAGLGLAGAASRRSSRTSTSTGTTLPRPGRGGHHRLWLGLDPRCSRLRRPALHPLPDGTEELYNLSNDPDEHVNRLDYSTGQGLTPADEHSTIPCGG